MRSGVLRHLIEIQRPQVARGSFQAASGAWEKVTEIRCELVPLSGRELIAAQQFVTEVSHEINIRWHPLLADRKAVAAMRCVCEGRIFNLQGVIDPDERRRWLTLFAVEALNNG